MLHKHHGPGKEPKKTSIVDVCSLAEPKFSLAMMALCVSCAGLQKSAVGSHHPKKSDAVNPNPAPSSPMLISVAAIKQEKIN